MVAYVSASAALHLIAWWSMFAAPPQVEPTHAALGAEAPEVLPTPAARTPPTPERLSILAATAAWFEADREPRPVAPEEPPPPPPPAPPPSASPAAMLLGKAGAGSGGAGGAKRPRRPGGTFQSVPLKEKKGVELTVPKGDDWCIEVRGKFIAGRGHTPLTPAGSATLRLGGHAKWSTLICQGKKCAAYTGPMRVKSGAVRVRINDNRFEDNEGDLRARYVACPR